MQSYCGHSTQPLPNEYALVKLTQEHLYCYLSNISEFNESKQRKLNLITIEMLRFHEKCFVQTNHKKKTKKKITDATVTSNNNKNEQKLVIFEDAKRTSIVKGLDLFDFPLADFN